MKDIAVKDSVVENAIREDHSKRNYKRLFINRKAIRELVESKGLRTSMEFFESLDAIVKQKVLRACERNKSLKRNTLKKDELYM